MNNAPSEILTQINQLLLSQQTLMQNRTLVNSLFNGDAPYTPEEQRDENIFTNCNFLEGTRIASNATNQINNAFFKGDRFFSVRLDKGPQRFRSLWSDIITKEINRELKRCRPYRSARESAHAQVVLHGPGPVVWRDRKTCVPGTAGIEDVLIPSGTLCDMENLDRFAIYQEMTWPQLERAVLGPVVDKGWNKKYAEEILTTLYKQGYQPTYYGNRWLFPEKLAEDYKEGNSRSFSSSLPRALLWNYFFRDEKSGKWNRRVILDYANSASMGFKESDRIEKNPQLIYERDNYADDWNEIIHWYIGNCSNVSPYRYHSIRSIGYLLFGVVSLQNKFRCRLSDHIFTNMLYLLRNVSDDSREKIGLIDLHNFGVVPDGVSFVNAAERFTADWNLVLMGLNQNRQLMAESSSSFLPDMQSSLGDGKEMTATETLVRQNTSITLTSAVLNQLGDQSLYEYREIARRFCIKNNPDPMAKRFRERIEKQGVPLDMLDFEAWEIMPEQTVGGGNKAVELTVSQALMQEVFPLTDPNGQRTLLRMRISSLTDNPDLALSLVPEAPEAANDDVQYAQLAFTILIEGLPFMQKDGTNHIVMAVTLMGMAGMALQQAEAVMQQPNGLGIAAQKVAGTANVLQHVEGEIAKIAQSINTQPNRKELVRGLIKQLEELKAGMQKLASAIMAAEQEQAQQQGSPEDAKTAAKLREIQATAETQRQIATLNADQKREQKQISWAEENERRNATTAAEIERKRALTTTEIQNNAMRNQADMMQPERQ